MVVALMLLDLLKSVYRRLRYNIPIQWYNYNLFYGVHSFKDAVLPTLLIVGLINAAWMEIFPKAEIGALYEKRDYHLDYTGTLEIDGRTTIFCIVTISRDSGGYSVEKVYLPYGKVEAPQDWNTSKIEDGIDVLLGDGCWWCELHLDSPANETDYIALDSCVIAAAGDFCASKKSSTYHLKECSHIKSVKEENLIYFKYRSDAEVLGYTFCKDCSNRY